MWYSSTEHPAKRFILLLLLFALAATLAHADNLSAVVGGDTLIPAAMVQNAIPGSSDNTNGYNANGYYEGSEAFQKLSEKVIKYAWNAVTSGQPQLQLFSAAASGNLATQVNGIDYGLRLSPNSVRLRIQYRF